MRCQHVVSIAVTPHSAGSSQARLPLFPGNELANIEQVMSMFEVELETKVREEGYQRCWLPVMIVALAFLAMSSD